MHNKMLDQGCLFEIPTVYNSEVTAVSIFSFVCFLYSHSTTLGFSKEEHFAPDVPSPLMITLNPLHF